jgi:4-hydroxyacetophenone monooxygenase
MALYQATHDPQLAEMSVHKAPYCGGAFLVTVLDEKYWNTVRQKALDFLRGGATERPPIVSKTEVRRMMELFAGEPVSDFAFAVGCANLTEEEFPLGAAWDNEPGADIKEKFKVIIIGAGFAGLATAVQLGRLGIPYVVIEREGGVGGTWWINDYPEARVDIASHHYQLSFMKNYPWKHWFAPQAELKQYAEAVVVRYGLKPHIRLNTLLTAARWDDVSATWRVSLRAQDGKEEILSANVLLSAAGLFNAPNMPDIPGLDTFRGKIFHTTQWDHSYDYAGKRIAQIGVGSTGAQLLPEIARKGAEVSVFQRSPQWVSGIPGYRDPVPAEVQWLFDSFPHYCNWYGFFNTLTNLGDIDGLPQNFDPEWRKAGGLVSHRNDSLRQHNIEYIKSKLGHKPDLVKKLTPDYPPFAKRPVVDNGWFDALDRDNVELVTESIERITPKGVSTRDGVEREFDLIVVCAGFKTERYLWPVRYEGRNGVTLEEEWNKDGARAYLGVTVPGFPNLFTLYGPNAQARAGGLIMWLEIWSRYATQSIVKMIEGGHRSLEVKRDVCESYNSRMDDELKQCVWSSVKSYYINEFGRQGTNMPWRPGEYFEWIKAPDLGDYLVE